MSEALLLGTPPERLAPRRRSKYATLRAWWFLGISALGLRLAAALFAGGLAHPQVFEYHSIAKTLLEGKGFVYASHGGVLYRSFDAPLYPFLCAAIYALTNISVPALLFVQMIVSAATAVMVAHIGESLFGSKAGLAAGWLVAAHPGLIVYSSLKAHALTFDALWFVLAIWAFIRLYQKRTLRQAAWAGIVFGLSLLQRPTVAVFFPVACIWWLMTKPQGKRLQEWRRLLVVAACALAVISPWLIRGYLIHGQPIFIRTTNWEVFWRGNNPYATGHSYIDGGHTVLRALPPERYAELERLPDELSQVAWFRKEALSFIQTHPWQFVRLTAQKFAQFWWFAPQTGTLYPRLWKFGYEAFYLFTVVLALFGVGWSIQRASMEQRHIVLFIIACLMMLALGQSLHYVEGRHRWAIEPILLLLSGLGLARVWEWLHRIQEGAGGEPAPALVRGRPGRRGAGGISSSAVSSSAIRMAK
ncbi:MAG: glycosyltransferase family 39 protein [Candidatus Omnitrophica bacterium]|nr:glycosyltransferase family 39 protein [Candidatus Omnitrophota bacterium]